MKKKIIAISILCLTLLGWNGIEAKAEEESYPQVLFTEDKEFSYGEIPLDQFVGMLPGDTAVQVIELKNEYKDEMSFFLSQETINEVKQANSASGGAFQYSLSIGLSEDGSDAISLLEQEVGGIDGNGEALEAFSKIEDLKDYSYVAKLKQGECAYIFLSLYVDGEGNDNQRKDTDLENENQHYGYSNYLSTLGFSFRAYEEEKVIVDEPVPTVIDRIIEVTKIDPYKGGDLNQKGLYIGMICIGCSLFAVVIARRKRGEQDDEKNK